jgi:rod shape determining protein RodA
LNITLKNWYPAMTENKSLLYNIDWQVFSITLILVVIGLFNIYSAEFKEGTKLFEMIRDMRTNFAKQIVFMIPAVILFIVVLLIDVRFFVNFSYAIYGIVLVLLLVTLVVGKEVSGSRSWIPIGVFNLQTSEFAKFATALALAKFLDESQVNVSKFKYSIIAFGIMALPVTLILLQNDFGSAIVFSFFIFMLFRQGLSPFYLYLPIVMAVLFIGALVFNINTLAIVIISISIIAYLLLYNKKNSLILIGMIAIACLAFAYSTNYVFQNIVEPHQRSRINVLLGKEMDLKGTGYNVHQSLIAIGSGGFVGKGFLNGTQTKLNFVPEQTTDFIFCTIGEEYGWLGSLVLLILFTWLLIRIIILSENQKYRFARNFGYAIVSIIFFHYSINIAMTIGLFPIIGIPLPLVSYGGSALIGFVMMIAVFLKLDADFKHYYN